MKRPRLVPEGPAAVRTVGTATVATRDRVMAAVNEPLGGWGRLPELALAAAVGLCLIAAGDAVSWRGERWGVVLFWAGLALLLTLFAARVLGRGAARGERLGLILVLGLACYLVKVFHSPLHVTDVDELSHWRTIDDILRTGHLFHENPLLTVSPFYPGLETTVAAVSRVSGLGIFPSALIVVGCGKLLLLLSLFLFFERLGGSARAASIACLIYTANPNFVFFDSMFSYESLALPLAAMLLYLAALVSRGELRLRPPLLLLFAGGAFAVAATHHMTSYLFLAVLTLWCLVAAFRSAGSDRWGEAKRLGVVTLVALTAVLAWTDLVSGLAIEYLQPVLGNAVLGLVKLALREQSARQLFKTSSGYTPAAWERYAGIASIALVLLSLPPGLLYVWRRCRRHAGVLTLAIAVLLYPATLALRLTSVGAETSNRASEFLFVAIGLVAALGLTGFEPRAVAWRRLRVLLLAPAAAVLFAGGLIIGTAPWARLPGPYLVGADDRSIDAEGIAAADWMRSTLGPGNRIASDRYGTLLMGSIGEQRAVTGLIDRIPTGLVTLFTSTEFSSDELQTLARGKIDYVEVDRRLSQSLPRGNYFDSDVPHTAPLDPAALAKFDADPSISRLYDSGKIAVYDVSELRYGP